MSEKESELPKSIVGFLDKYGEKLFKGVKSVYIGASDEARLNWRFGYENYLAKAYHKHFYVKTFLSFNQPRPISDFYVPLSVACGHYECEASISGLTKNNPNGIIVATAGSGKTMMMRHLFIDTIDNTDRVPVFVELREINHVDLGLVDLIRRKLRDNGFDFADDYVTKAIEAGHFTFLLDGFDEVTEEKRRDLVQAIGDLAVRYPKNNLIVSSRPDDSLYKWEEFQVWRVQPLSALQASELVQSTDTDEDIKTSFVAALQDRLYAEHHSFLSNPLLLSIMLITYANSGDIPQKISTFYDRAYTALFDQHDARKAYSRVKKSGLDIADFRRLFSAFCFISYINDQYSFSETELYDYVEKAKSLTEIDANTADFVSDATQAICLLLREGLEITFSHRSFQEYFAILFNSSLDHAELKSEFLEKRLSSFEEDILELPWEVSPATVEEFLIVPRVSALERVIGYDGTEYTKEHHARCLSIILSRLEISHPEEFEMDGDELLVSVTISDYGLNKIFHFLRKHYVKESFQKKDDDGTLLALNEYGMYHVGESIGIEKAVADPLILAALFSGYHWLSGAHYEECFRAKAQIVANLGNRESLLRNELASLLKSKSK